MARLKPHSAGKPEGITTPIFTPVRVALVAEGWLTPDTYDACFWPVESVSAVYLFARFDLGSLDRALVAYVGMTSDLARRLRAHNVLREIAKDGHWVQRWFRPTPKAELRNCEAELIRKFNPPWNIQGRPRGVIPQ